MECGEEVGGGKKRRGRRKEMGLGGSGINIHRDEINVCKYGCHPVPPLAVFNGSISNVKHMAVAKAAKALNPLDQHVYGLSSHAQRQPHYASAKQITKVRGCNQRACAEVLNVSIP